MGLKTNHHKQERSTNGHLRPSTSGVVHLHGPDWEVINLGLIVAKLIPCVPCALCGCGESEKRDGSCLFIVCRRKRRLCPCMEREKDANVCGFRLNYLWGDLMIDGGIALWVVELVNTVTIA